ncbi:unnamed protein product [Euphydryas editha]|uniref:RPA-interacting protein C-terminal domain-containing protein n=1 Tax=Euphydryas editha TaxID=104508 RepID=A0AAU9TG27_EUPED|nr:unnamed protein product [Euphydryas editha]
MNKIDSSPTFKNLKSKKLQSPIQLKEKMRKDYKNNVKTCRDILLNRLRGSPMLNIDLRTTLTDIYNQTFNDFYKDGFQIELLTDNEETKILEEIKMELIQNELNWWLEEYEKSNSDIIDWSSLHKDDNVICLLCQKNNFTLINHCLSCTFCNIEVKTEMSLPSIKKQIDDCIERHSAICTGTAHFMAVSDLNGPHIYFICEACMDMQFIV